MREWGSPWTAHSVILRTGSRDLECACLPVRRYLVTDPKLSHYFKDLSMGRMRHLQSDFIAYLLGCPGRTYKGRQLSQAHEHLGITHDQFDQAIAWLHRAIQDCSPEAPAEAHASVVSQLEGLRGMIVSVDPFKRPSRYSTVLADQDLVTLLQEARNSRCLIDPESDEPQGTQIYGLGLGALPAQRDSGGGCPFGAPGSGGPIRKQLSTLLEENGSSSTLIGRNLGTAQIRAGSLRCFDVGDEEEKHEGSDHEEAADTVDSVAEQQD